MIPFEKKILLPISESSDSRFWNVHIRKRWTISLFIQTSLLFAARLAMPVCASQISKQFGWNKENLGAVMGSFFWGYLTTQIIGGYMADRIGGDKVLWMSGLAWSGLIFVTPYIANLYTSKTQSVVLLAITRVLLGVFQGVHYPSMMSLLAKKIHDSKRSLPLSIILSAANFGSLICGGLGSVIMENYGWEKVFYAVGILSLTWTYSLWLLWSEEQSHTILAIDKMVFSQSSTTQNSVSSVEVPWRKILTNKSIWAMIFAHFCNGNCFYILLSWLPTYFYEHFPDEKGWVYNVVPWIFSIPACVVGGCLSDYLLKRKWGLTKTRKCLETVSLGGVAIFGILLPYCESFFMALMCSGLAIALQTFHNSGVLIVPQDIAPKYSGSVFGVMNVFGAIPGFLGVYTTGYILSVSGSWKTVFYFMGFVNFAGALTFLIWGSSDRLI